MKRHRWLLFPLLVTACAGPGAAPPTPASTSPAASAAPSPSAVANPGRVTALLEAEHRRRAGDVKDDDLASRDVSVRRAAARALARIGADSGLPLLRRALSDDDDDVVAWAAYGLGFACKGHEAENVAALVATALRRFVGAQTNAPGRFSASEALARAVGKCGAETSEPTLVEWLRGPRPMAAAAALGLGDLAVAKKKLREESLVALFNAAEGSASQEPLGEALFAPGRLEHLPPSVLERLRQVATGALARAAPERLFAVRALGRAGPDAAPELVRVVASPDFTMTERAEAARGLARLGDAGKRGLAELVPKLAPKEPVDTKALLQAELHVLLTVLDGLDTARGAGRELEALAKLTLPEGASAAEKRRLAWLRCGAAKALAGKSISNPLLIACDVAGESDAQRDPPDPKAIAGLVRGNIGQRALVAVLGRAPLEGARLAAWKSYALAGELRAREDALALLEEHEEVADAAEVLAAALSAKSAGLVGSAADLLAKRPQLARETPKKRGKKKTKEGDTWTVSASPAVTKALLAALSAANLGEDPEQAGALIEAAGALGLAEAETKLRAACGSSYPTLRTHAAKALELVTGKKTPCDAPAEGGELPVELTRPAATGPITLQFETELGPASITLDPAIAPAAASRMSELVRAGYYDGNVVHRIVPGFVTQFGAPEGDGWGGPPMPPLRCETSPLPFAQGTVGVALAGRDTGSSQLFVMHGRLPHLDGGYAWIGTAEGPWTALVDGDHIVKARVKESP
jgi:cyclophilin family peptidyl-prolyl cis-trans isomerase/HEAT repeat protein